MAVWLTIKHMFTYGSVAHNMAHNKTHVYIWQYGSQ